MKIPATLLQALSLALLAGSCTNEPAHRIPEVRAKQTLRDSCFEPSGPGDTVKQAMPPIGNGIGDDCPACGRG